MSDNGDNTDEDEVKCKSQLTEWKLSKYAPKFIQEGYEDIDVWGSLTEETLTGDLGMKKGHAKKFLQFYKATFGASNSNSNPKNVSGSYKKKKSSNASKSKSKDFVEWLRVNKLSQMVDKLAAFDVTELSDMASLVNKKDIEEFALDLKVPVLLRTKFIDAVSKLAAKKQSETEIEIEIEIEQPIINEAEEKEKATKEKQPQENRKFHAQLTEWRLGDYASQFVAEGYDDMADWPSLTVEILTGDLEMKSGHARRFVNLCKETFGDAPNSNSNSNTVNPLSKMTDELSACDVEKVADLASYNQKAMELTALYKNEVSSVGVQIRAQNININSNSNSDSVPAAFDYDEDDDIKQGMDEGQEGNNNNNSDSNSNNNTTRGAAPARRESTHAIEARERAKRRTSYAHLCGNNNRVPCLSERDVNGKPNKTIMVIGATGTGKTTLLNSMMNYLYEVEYADKYRLRLIEEAVKDDGQAVSQTDDVVPYYLAPPILDYNLTVIDSPGFGDSRGMDRDQQITRDVQNCFETQISEIDAICFVMCAALPRLTPIQRYIFGQVLSIFGNDIAGNIFIMLTFADSKKPPAIAALKAAEIPFVKYFKFNNSAFELDEDEEEEEEEEDEDEDDEDAPCLDFSEMFWVMGMNSFKKFFQELNKVETKSLTLTKQVLTRRQQLQLHIENINPVIQDGFDLLESMRAQILLIKKNEAIVDSSKNFTMQVSKTRRQQKKIAAGLYTTICDNCKWTCHKKCAIPNTSKKRKCHAIDSNTGYCTACPNKCHWSEHTNQPYVWISVKYFVTQDIQELKDKYMDSKSNMSASEQIVAGMVGDVEKMECTLALLIESVRECLNELSKIALRPNVLKQDDYIDKLIKAEQNYKKQGWQRRVKALESIKEKNSLMTDIQRAVYNPFENYSDVTNYIANMKSNNDDTKKKKQKNGFFSFLQ